MIFDLKVNGQRKADGISTVSPVFSWECGTERQFTVQMSSSPKFQSAVMYLDTRNCYCTYDGVPLQAGKTYSGGYEAESVNGQKVSLQLSNVGGIPSDEIRISKNISLGRSDGGCTD